MCRYISINKEEFVIYKFFEKFQSILNLVPEGLSIKKFIKNKIK